MDFNFELLLFYIILLCGVIALADIVFWAPERKLAAAYTTIKPPVLVEYARSFFPVLLIVFLLRAFLFEPFRIPSGSLEPTLLVGDFILVNKFDYGLRLPILHTKIYSISDPQRGDIFVFRDPKNPGRDLVKRVIGIPGDNISYIHKTLYLNGEKIPQQFIQNTFDQDAKGHLWPVVEKQENLLGVQHAIYQNPEKDNDDFRDVVVPEHMYFAMGDNRDDSLDSRYWGFAPEKNIVGKATHIGISFDTLARPFRWERFGRKL